MAFAKWEGSPVTADLSAIVREFILKQFPLARKRQSRNSDALLDSGIVDSTGILEIVNFMEQKYGFVVSDEDLVPENFQSIEQIAAFVESKIKA